CRVEDLLEQLTPLTQRQVAHGLSVELEQVEGQEDERARAALQRLETRRAVLVEGAHLAVEHRRRRSHRLRHVPRDLPEPLREVPAVPAREPRLTAVDRHDRAVAVPLGLEEPVGAPRKSLGERRELGPDRLPAGRRRLLAEQQPVLLLAVEVRRHERPDALRSLPVEPEREAAVALLLEELVRPAVPDLDGAGAVLTLRDLALERAVVERVIFDMHREMPLACAKWQALGHGPARE